MPGHWSEAECTKADLSGAILQRADLRDTELKEADLTGAKMQWANLEGSWFDIAFNSAADLNNVNLTDEDLTGAKLWYVDFRQTTVTGAIISKSRTKGVDFDMWKTRGAPLIPSQAGIEDKAVEAIQDVRI